MELADVAAAVPGGFQHIGDADCVSPQGAFGTQCHAVEGDSAAFRIHPGEEYASVRAAERTCADRIRKHNGLVGEPVQIRGDDRVCLPSHVPGIFRLIPECKGRGPELVREHIDDIGHGIFCRAAGHGCQAADGEYYFSQFHLLAVFESCIGFQKILLPVFPA